MITTTIKAIVAGIRAVYLVASGKKAMCRCGNMASVRERSEIGADIESWRMIPHYERHVCPDCWDDYPIDT